MTPTRPALVAATLSLFLLVTACTGGSDPVARDTGSADGPSAPTKVPEAKGPVRTASLATVMDVGSGPVELCLGAVAESYPPQCGGPAIPNWDWEIYGGGGFEEESEIRWGPYALTGTWDGSEFTVTDSIIAALYDTFYEEPPAAPAPGTTYSTEELESIGAEVGDLPGAQGQYADADHVYLDVTYDDGSIQDYVDAAYGEDVVLVTSALVDVT